MKKVLLWLKTSAGKITIFLLIFGCLLIGTSFLPVFKQSSHLRDNFENVLIGIGTNIFGIIVTISFVQHIFDKQSEKNEKELEREKIIRFSQIMSFRIQKYFAVFSQITTPLSEYSKESEKKINPDFKFEDMKDLYFPCLLMSEEQKSAISVFYAEEKHIKEYMFRMIEKIDFNYFPNIQKLLLAFIKQSEAYDVSNAILKYEQMNDGYMIKHISQQISTNPTDHWVELFESGNLPSNIINNFVLLYRLLQKEFFILTEYNKAIQELSKTSN